MRWVIAACILLSAYFSATETAFNSVNTLRLQSLAEKGDARAALVLSLLRQYDKLLSTILVGNNIVNIAASSLATVMCVQRFGEEAGPGLSTLIITLLLLLFGEISPKSIAKSSAESFSKFSAPFLRIFMILLSPLTFLFGIWQRLLLKLFRPKEEPVTDEEILSIVKEAEKEGGIDKQESALIFNSIAFNEKEAEDILTPRMEMEILREDASQDEILKKFTESAYSRLPVYRGRMDNIIGILHQKDFYADVFARSQPPAAGANASKGAGEKAGAGKDAEMPSKRAAPPKGKFSIAGLIRPVLFTPPHKPIGELLREMQRGQMHVAIVLDEYGGILGMVSIEDILEELVGEIWDEHEEAVQEIRKISDRAYLVKGSTNLEKFFHALHYEGEYHSEATTVSGWITELCGHLPRKGERIRFANMELQVREMGERRIEIMKAECLT